jgi:hypothetical protein
VNATRQIKAFMPEPRDPYIVSVLLD